MDHVFKIKIVSVKGSQYKTVTLLAEGYRFECGQYLNVIDKSGKQIPLSIASSPTHLPKLRVIFKPEPNNPDSHLIEQLVRQKVIEVSSPQGKVRHPQDDKHLLLIAKGTGISQALAIIDHSKAIGSNKNVKLLWINSEDSKVTADQNLEFWLSEADSLIFDEAELLTWLEQNQSSINNAHCILTGDPEFVYLIKTKLTKNQIFLASLQSDVFEYSPL